MGTAELDLAADRPMSSGMQSSVDMFLMCRPLFAVCTVFVRTRTRFSHEFPADPIPEKELVHAACTAAETPPEASSVAMSQVRLA